MPFDFDSHIERRGTLSIKYDLARAGCPEGTLPLWVADMDFRTPPCVTEALEKQARHGIFGYSEPDDAYYAAVAGWFAKRFGWTPQKDWFVLSPGIVTALYIAVRGLTEEGDGVLVQQPVYYPFNHVVRDLGRKLVVNTLREDEDGRYAIDFADFEKQIQDHRVKLFILCSPHNPVARVWTETELRTLGDLCLKHGVTVFSDEIHADFVYPGHRHTIFSSLSDALAELTITATAPSKTFNLAGLQISNLFIPNEKLRLAFRREYTRFGLSQSGVMGLVACRAAYEGGAEWLDALLAYLGNNMDALEHWAARTDGVRFRRPEGTYLGWIDFRGTGKADGELDKLLKEKARVWLNLGGSFGTKEGAAANGGALPGSGHMRLNFACPKATLTEALARISSVTICHKL
ncbi:MAG: pyridoxal phosphate-dependent aminotransferase [Clostridiales Family XIII bacterium]|jgi:cystathionine beta-lyase|nr:pyridoxal phosphate-dependent aminotransferase [Clostridiales Family XIII bacterium]